MFFGFAFFAAIVAAVAYIGQGVEIHEVEMGIVGAY